MKFSPNDHLATWGGKKFIGAYSLSGLTSPSLLLIEGIDGMKAGEKKAGPALANFQLRMPSQSIT